MIDYWGIWTIDEEAPHHLRAGRLVGPRLETKFDVL